MPSDVTTIRAEIKAWERSFKETNGREPTIDDIKKQPDVAQKYKLYKKLSKAVIGASSSNSQHNEPPSTPPRQTPSGSKPPKLLMSASRVVEATAPLASFNPFSPHKKDKGKQKVVAASKPVLNPFASPRKSTGPSSQRRTSPFPSIQSIHPSTSNQILPNLPEPPSAISRARKRLRGEPVSPSPNKEKRRRLMSPASLPFPKLQLNGPESGDDDSEDDEEAYDVDGGASSFVGDSPMKPTTNGKEFTLLFEETVKPTSTTDLFGSGILPTKSQSDSRPVLMKPLPSMDDDLFSDASRLQKNGSKSSAKIKASLKSQPSAMAKSRSKLVQMTLPMVNGTSDNTRKTSSSDIYTSTKRVLPELERGDDDLTTLASPSDPPSATTPLLPPSPNSNTSRPSGKSKPNGARSGLPLKASTSRKKVKLRDDDDNIMEGIDDDDRSSSDGIQNVTLVHPSRGIRTILPTQEDNSEMGDPILNYSRRVLPRGKGPVSSGGQGGNGVDGPSDEKREGGGVNVVNADETVRGNLPHELRRVLVLESLKSKKVEYEENMIVKRLLSGRRVVHYDPQKGGEIWGVGEDEMDELAEHEERGIDQEDDDWEGDPIPWEVGELSESRYHSDGM